MLGWEGILEDYVIRYSDRIKKATRPLRDRFGISCFSHTRITSDGKYCALGDRPDWAEYYISQKFFLSDPAIRHPDVYSLKCCTFETISGENYRETAGKDIRSQFNLEPGTILIEKGSDYVELSVFAGNQEVARRLEYLALNHSHILTSFVSYFKKELRSIFRQMGEEQLFLPPLKGEDFYCKLPVHNVIDVGSLRSFLADLGMESQLKKAALLSRRERQCLKQLLLGKSGKDIAADLSLSPRTIEFYFENIKDKLGCGSKQDVFLVAKDLEELGLL